MEMLTRSGVLLEDAGQTYLAENDSEGGEAGTLARYGFCRRRRTDRIAFGPLAG